VISVSVNTVYSPRGSQYRESNVILRDLERGADNWARERQLDRSARKADYATIRSSGGLVADINEPVKWLLSQATVGPSSAARRDGVFGAWKRSVSDGESL